MGNSIKVTKWEVKKNITNKSFLISIFLTPIMMLVFGALPSLLGKIEMDKTHDIYVIDEVGIYSILEESVPRDEVNLIKYNGNREALEKEIQGKKLTSYIIFDNVSISSGQISIFAVDDTIPPTRSLNNGINQALRLKKLNEVGLSFDEIAYINRPYMLNLVSLDGEEKDFSKKIFPAILAGLIYFSIFISGTMTFQSAVQEKRDKMTEILLSSITTTDLMRGKILGCFILGMIQVIVWLAFAIPIAQIFFNIPVLSLILVPELPLMLFFSLIGYLLFSSMFVSMGATIEDIQSSGNFQGILFVLPMLPMFFIGAIVANPHGIVAKIGSFFPFSAPGVMLFRLVLASSVPLIDIILSISILVITTWFAMKLAGKLFRTAILMYGKNATPAEIYKWIRH